MSTVLLVSFFGVFAPPSHPLSLSFQVDVFKDYFGELEEESIRDNFVIIYELLDETMDFGYPQTMESKILREYITQASVVANRHYSIFTSLSLSSFVCL